jgi:parallel beta-helix repeat protein
MIALVCLVPAGRTHAAGYDFFVNASSGEAVEDGSEQYPWKTINAALNHIRSNKLKKKNVFVKNGTYRESVEVKNNTKIIGEDRHLTVIDATGSEYGIRMDSTSSTIRNLTIQNASVNLKISKKSKVLVSNCSLKDATSNGVEGDRTSPTKKYKFTLKDSSVKDSGKRGMYIFRRKIEISNSDIESNDEEGIDLHTGARATITGCDIKDNGESGIEMMMENAKSTVKSNTISGNKSQGVTVQIYDGREGRIKILNNSIKNNSHFGIRYARYDHGKLKVKFRDFIKKCVKVSKNTISGNDSGDYAYE